MTDVRDATTNTTQSTPRTGGFIWYELLTPDADGAKAFYDAVVGWNVTSGPPEYGTYKVIARSDGGFAGGVLTLTDEMRRHCARPTWLGYIHVADVDEALKAIETAGGKTQMQATDIPNVGRIAMMTDPFGAPFYVMTPIPPADNPNAESDVFSPSAEQRVGWNELQTGDVEQVREFYGDLFGWGSEEFMDMGPLGKYRFWDRSGDRIGAVFPADEGQNPHWRFYIRVPSIAKAKEIAEAKGGTIHMGPHPVPTGDFILIGNDPQGAEFALVGGV